MKKLLFILLTAFTLQAAQADNDKAITFNQLPNKAQTFIKKHFANHKVAFVKMDKKILNSDYDVILANGNKLEFDKNGEWTDLDCRRGGVPAKTVPSAIKKFVKTKHPNATIVSLERDHDSYEVKLSNAWEIKFDKQFNVTDMSMDD